MNPFGVIGIIIGITNIAIGLIVYFYDRHSRTNQLWALFAVSVSIWGFGSYIISVTTDPVSALFWWHITHAGVIFIPFSFIAFTYSFLGKKSHVASAYVIIATTVFLILDFIPYFNLIASVRFVFNSFYYDGPPTPLYNVFVATFVFTIFYAIVISLQAYLTTKDPARKQQLLFFILASAIGSAGGSTSFLPVYGIYVYPYLNASIILFPFIIGYAILRHGLFNPKAIATELFIFCLWIFVFLRALLATNSQDVLLNLILLILLIFIGILLIRSVRKEVETRERIELLAKDLQTANDRLRELDKQKTEFISFATHQLRAPLTAIKGYASLIVEGDVGAIPPKAKDAVERVYESASTMAAVVDDYLNVSRIELGSMKYDLVPLNMKELTEEVVAELKPNMQKSGLSFSFRAAGEGPWTVSADPDKLKQVVANIIDNSVKYTPSGSVEVTLERVPNADGTIPVRLTIADTGIGIDPAVMPKLFQKFSRAEGANKQNIHGTGLGLFIARDIIAAHKGRIWAESPGEGKGSKFIVEIPPA